MGPGDCTSARGADLKAGTQPTRPSNKPAHASRFAHAMEAAASRCARAAREAA